MFWKRPPQKSEIPGIVFTRRSQVFEVANPQYEVQPQVPAAAVERSTNRRLTMSDLHEFTKSLAWLSPAGWEDPVYSTPIVAFALSQESISRLGRRGVNVGFIPWPDSSMGTNEYCSTVYSDDLSCIQDPANRMRMYLSTIDTPATVAWGGADDPQLVYRIEGQDFYQCIAGTSSQCRNAIMEHLLDALDFTAPLEGPLDGMSGDNPWAEDVTCRFTPFYRRQNTPRSAGVTGLLSYIVD